jgi:hypothetical protein
VKYHWGDLGVEGSFTSDVYASYSAYVTGRLGAYYEYSFE